MRAKLHRTLIAFTGISLAVLASCISSELNAPASSAPEHVRLASRLTPKSSLDGRLSVHAVQFAITGQVVRTTNIDDVEFGSSIGGAMDGRTAWMLSSALDNKALRGRLTSSERRASAHRLEDVARDLFMIPIVLSADAALLVGASGADSIFATNAERTLVAVSSGQPGAPATRYTFYHDGVPASERESRWQSVDGGWVLIAAKVTIFGNGTTRFELSAQLVDALVDDRAPIGGGIAAEELPCGDESCEAGGLCLGLLAARTAAYGVWAAAEVVEWAACNPLSPEPFPGACQAAENNSCAAFNAYEYVSAAYNACRAG